MGTRGRKSADSLLTVVEITGQRLEPPDTLTPRQAQLWAEIVESLPADYFRPADGPLLAAFCKANDFYLQAAGEIEANGVTIEDERGRRYANPAGQLVVTQASAMAQLAVKLRLCPSTRMSEKVAGTKTAAGAVGAKPWQRQS